MVTQGTTPRRLTDLIGSLCDLTSGSGDKGTPVVFIQGYFDNLSDELKNRKLQIFYLVPYILSPASPNPGTIYLFSFR